MNLQERDTLQAAMQASEEYSNRLYSFDAINDDVNNRSVNLVAHCKPRQTPVAKINEETIKLNEFAKGAIGRELTDQEVVVRAIEAPTKPPVIGR